MLPGDGREARFGKSITNSAGDGVCYIEAIFMRDVFAGFKQCNSLHNFRCFSSLTADPAFICILLHLHAPVVDPVSMAHAPVWVNTLLYRLYRKIVNKREQQITKALPFLYRVYRGGRSV